MNMGPANLCVFFVNAEIKTKNKCIKVFKMTKKAIEVEWIFLQLYTMKNLLMKNI